MGDLFEAPCTKTPLPIEKCQSSRPSLRAQPLERLLELEVALLLDVLGAHLLPVEEAGGHRGDVQAQVVAELLEVLVAGDEVRLAGDLGQVVAGQLDCRNNTDSQWTLFLSGGTGAEDVAVATRLYERAAANGIGTEFSFGLPYEFEL